MTAIVRGLHTLAAVIRVGIALHAGSCVAVSRSVPSPVKSLHGENHSATEFEPPR